ncbi:MAG: type II toxin-antitoxin system Phd/YefM family antitoxin [Balneolaceae bacterium]|jgi:prevent-host-death family protein|nr:MAG: type II toxin-antitoxin system Phd/YefM family antitoxin [Balneolaceae bacterium]
MAKTVNIHEAKTHLSALIKEVLAGEKVTIAKNNEPVVELIKIDPKQRERKFGTLKGKIIVHGDFSDSDKEIENLFSESKLFPDEEDSDR